MAQLIQKKQYGSLSPGCKEKLDLAGTGSFYNEMEADIVVQLVLSLIYAERRDVCSCGVRQVLSGSKSSVRGYEVNGYKCQDWILGGAGIND
ncbi:hypothetical protein M8C21_005080 [Ambrosia artemisiifolia]|uniref:Uncharacterized protein n=1 Tax=Ambrosia artemisiifolia TaxID=4212 RepID=A0AAD5CAK3_AMBAR|nr:hypothetical protein M8C21_005080 [Ambrosia artemisiifolia]